MPEENRVFDVTKPKHVTPPATSKPVITGHHPEAFDHTVKESESEQGSVKADSEPTRIHVTEALPPVKTPDEDDEDNKSDSHDYVLASHERHIAAPDEADIKPDKEPEPAVTDFGINTFSEPAPAETAPAASVPEPAPQPQPEPEPEPEPEPAPEEPKAASAPEQPAGAFGAPAPAALPADTALSTVEPPKAPDDQAAQAPAPQPQPHIEGLHLGPAESSGGKWKWVVLAVLILLVAAYLVIDSGLVSTGINLPFHVFKQKNSPTASPAGNSPAANSQPPAASSAVPAGFKNYQLNGTPITFAAPVAWGTPDSTTEQGYSKRGGSNQPDGVYAYLVSFTSNKDVQIAVTSSKYLPPARATQYYDYLQWCVGTNDGQIYESALHFASAGGVDTPTTITCDQGPVPNVAKLDATTIVQAKATDTTNKVIGDIYTKNLTDTTLVVLRVKDAAMTNGTAIRQMLGTVQVGG